MDARCRKGAKQDTEEAGESQDDAQRRSDTDGLEGTVGDSQAYKVAVGAVAQQEVDMVGDRAEVPRIGRVLECCESFVAHGRRDVELLLGTGDKEGLDYGVETTTACCVDSCSVCTEDV